MKSGDTIAEVETDKAIMELVARGDGILRARLVEEGTTSPIGAVIGVIAAADEDISALTGGSADCGNRGNHGLTRSRGARRESPLRRRPPPRSPRLRVRMWLEHQPNLPVRCAHLRSRGDWPPRRVFRSIRLPAPAPTAASSVATSRRPRSASAISASPRETAVPPSAPAAAASTPAPASAMAIVGDYKDVPLTQIRKTIARRLGESIGPIPTFYLTSEIDMTKVGQLREQMAAAGDQFKVSVNDIVIKAVAIALTRHPECNAHWLGDSIRYFSAAHIGMAVATDDGLIVPVIRDAHTKGLGQIGREARDFAKRARERKLAPAEYTGGTFSVSNLGMFGIDQFTAIINPPEAAILAVGSTETKPVWENGAFVPRQRMRVTLSCDHRVIDGAIGAKFLQTLRQLLEAPMMMLY